MLTQGEKSRLLKILQLKEGRLRMMVRNGGPRQAIQDTRDLINILAGDG